MVGTGDNPGDGYDHHGYHHPITTFAVGSKEESLDEVFPSEHVADARQEGCWRMEGFERIRALPHPLAQTIMIMFVVTEVHPFSDGNGRTARLAMTCMLSARCNAFQEDLHNYKLLFPAAKLAD
jgi:Fic/DOC family